MTARRATYRLQLRAGFGFDEVAALADYLADLGVSHVYLSPYLQARRGSSHGYDVVDHRQVNPELGGEVGLTRMSRALEARGLRQLLDVVPNHMAIGPDNAWWWDVLEHGRSSRYARHFDFDAEDVGVDHRVLLPILGERYADAVAGGRIAVVREGSRFVVLYGDQRMPASPRSLADPLARVARAMGSTELAFFAEAYAAVASPDPGPLARLCVGEPAVAAAIDAELGALAADPARLDAFLEQQSWRLGFWRNALRELQYRRFFDVADLAGLRVEDPVVFEDVHARVLAWLGDGTLDGVRIDHVDGLRDPTVYLTRLRSRAPGAWIVVEKILAAGERVPAAWPVDGTTGYDWLRILDGVLVDPAGRPALERTWARFGGDPATWEEQARVARLDVIHGLLASERDRLVALATRMIVGDPELRDVTSRELADAIAELLASLPVYRTYVRPGEPVSATDRAWIDAAFAAAAPHRPEVDRRVWAALRAALLLERPGDDAVAFALRFQQTSGAVMAKGIEDTLFYRNLCFVMLDEVGGAPERFGVGLDELHDVLAAAPPGALVATATHDTKRGEDVRARLAVLSEIAETWSAEVDRWSDRARRHRTGDLPDLATEYLIWQTLVGAWPLSPERLRTYLEKAAREAKRHTSWMSPNPAYEEALFGFADAVLADRELIATIASFVASITPVARRNTLTRTLLKLTVPGVPDLYQGAELWDLSLVDPDNRRPVDFEARRALLQRARDLPPAAVLADADDGLPKLWLIHRVLQARRRHPEWFDGPCRRLAVSGPRAEGVIAFARGERLVIIAPRLTAPGLPGADTTIELPAGEWVDTLSGELVDGRDRIGAATAWSAFPVALLVPRS